MSQVWKNANVVKWVSNGIGAFGCLYLFGFPGLLSYAAAFVIGAYLPVWLGAK